MKSIFYIFLFFSYGHSLTGQDLVFSAEVSTDHATIEEVIELTYHVRNGSGDFTAPGLKDFAIVGGPNVSSSIQIVNGKITREKSYTYFIKPISVGELVINPAHLYTDDGNISTTELYIYVDSASNNNHKSTSSHTNKSPQSRRSIFDKKSIKKI